MEKIIRKILRESDFEWVEDVPSSEDWFSGSRARYIGRPKSYTKNQTPMERLMIKLGLAMEADEPVNGSYSYGLQRYVSDEEASEVYDNQIGTSIKNLKLSTVLLDNDLRDNKALVVWLGNLRPQERMSLFQKLKRMGFSFKKGNNYGAKPSGRIYFIKINPNGLNGMNTIEMGSRYIDQNKIAQREMFESILDGGDIEYNSREILNKL